MAVEIIDERQKRRLKEHTYSVHNCSILENKYMNIFWDSLEQIIPKTWAPNTLSTVGMAFNVVTTIILIYFSPAGTSDVSSWVLVLCALGVFVLQTLDNLDGRQARRNNIDGPLDEVFDHGCDAISGVFVTVGVCVACKAGDYPYLFLYQVCLTELSFYMAHWRAYATDTVKFDIVDVTEIQMAVIALHLISAANHSVFDVTVPILEQPLRLLALSGCMILTCVFTLKKFADMIYFRSQNGLSVIAPAFPIGLVLLLQVYIAQQSTIFLNQPCMFLLCFGLPTAKMTTSLVVAHMTLSDVQTLDSCLVGPLILLINTLFGTAVPEHYVLWIVCIYNLQDLVRYDARICQQVCEVLDMYCFSVEKKPNINRLFITNGTKKIS